LVALEAIMSHGGDVNSIQYLNVRSATEDIIKFMQKTGLTKDFLQSSVSVFNETRKIFVHSESFDSVPPEFVPATLVAICIKNNTDDEVDDETFSELIVESYTYLSNYQNKCF
jgi:hypothetical protein